jgi:Na+-transporting NADH:ubiquinone oxidoreductase subunit F
VDKDLKIEIPDSILQAVRYKGKLVSKRLLTPDIVELKIELIDPASMRFTAGQFIQFESRPYAGKESVTRAYSLSSPPSDSGHIELIIRRVPDGICTTWVFDHLSEGQEVLWSGPYGEFRLSITTSPVIFIAGGSGMAPIYSMLRHMSDKKIARKVFLFFSAANQIDLFYLDEMNALLKILPGFSFIPSVSRVNENSLWTGECGNILDVLAKHIPDCSGYEAYLCGSPGLIDASVKRLKGCGMPGENIYYDKFV